MNQSPLSDVPLLQKRESFALIQRRLAHLDPSTRIIERRSNVSRQEFLEKYYAANRPVILTDIMGNWKAMTRWTPEYLKEKCGHLMVNISADREKNPTYEMDDTKHRRTVKFAEFVDMVNSAEGTNDFYLTARDGFLKHAESRALLEDIEIFPEYLDPEVDSMLFWYGPKGTVTPLHHDLINIFLVQVQGTKRVKMIPPTEMDLVYNHQGVYTFVDCENPDYSRFPKYKNATVMECDLAPGEVLFIPVGWWHHVRSLDPCISFSLMNFVFPNHFPEWVNPPGNGAQNRVQQPQQRQQPQMQQQPQMPVAIPTMDESWLGWVKENLGRGCDPMGIVEILMNHRFPIAAIRKAMGNQFPGVPQSTSHMTGVDHKALCKVPVEVMSNHPGFQAISNDKIQLFTIDDFITSEECDVMVDIISQNLRPSTITNYKEGYRTSHTSDLSLIKRPEIKAMDLKIAETIGIPIQFSEGIQGQKYRVGEEFKPHTDYFEPHTPEFEQNAKGWGNRTWTFMVYLNDTPKGGGTQFPNVGQIFYPKKGKAVVWNNLYADGAVNPYTLHQGMPVEEGDKYIITKWFRERTR